MSYEIREGSVDEGRPVEAYLISGIFGSYRYTDADEEVTIDGQVFRPAIIDRNGVNLASITEPLQNITIIVPQDLKLSMDYGAVDTPDRLLLKVYRAHRGDDWSSDFKQVWEGIGYGYTFEGRQFSIATVSSSQLHLSREVDQVKFQLKCNHSLYDGRCQVNKLANRSETSVTAIDELLITVGASPWPNGDLVYGRLVSMSSWESRAILSNTGNVLKIDRPFLRIDVGDKVRLIRGCNKSFERCDSGFHNTERFGGFPFKPEELKIVKVGVGDLPGPKVEVLDDRLIWPNN